jgi:RHS repeat-associated protein
VGSQQCEYITVSFDAQLFNPAYLSNYISYFTADPTFVDYYSIGSEGRQQYDKVADTYTPYYYVKDHLGSTRMTVEGYTGCFNVVEASMYDSYGAIESVVPLSGTLDPTKEKFTGNEFDGEGGDGNGVQGIGMFYFGRRYYDPEIGTFASTDPCEQYWNAYSYCGGDPINNIDLEGLDAAGVTDFTPAPLSLTIDPKAAELMASQGAGIGQSSASLNFAMPNLYGAQLEFFAMKTADWAPTIDFGMHWEATSQGEMHQGYFAFSKDANSYIEHMPTPTIMEKILCGIGPSTLSSSGALASPGMLDPTVVLGSGLLKMGVFGIAMLKSAASMGEEDGLTYLYQKVSAEGAHLKFGITDNPATRYTKSELAGGRLRILAKGARREMLELERKLHSTLPLGKEEFQKGYIAIQKAMGLKPPPY